MATWDESSAVGGGMQGAGTGAAIGSAIMPGAGTAIGAGVGLLVGGVAGGFFGGKAKDAAKEAEKRRQEEIRRAIERQNQKTFDAKVNAEQWALADIGVGQGDMYGEAIASRDQIISNVDRSMQNAASQYERFMRQQNINESRSEAGLYVGKTRKKNLQLFERAYEDATRTVRRSTSEMASNEGLIAALEDPQITRY